MKQLFCPIRNEWVAAQPEEYVRQRLIRQMIEQLGYPKENLVVEKGLKQMPHLTSLARKTPTRRADIVCFSKGIHPTESYWPLLLIECKAVRLNAKTIHQVVGYNHYLQAAYVVIANEDEVQTGQYNSEAGEYRFHEGLPTYASLIATLKGSELTS